MKTTKREDILAGIRALNNSVCAAFAAHLPASVHQEIGDKLLALLNSVDASAPREEFRQVVRGAMDAIGIEPTNTPD